MILLQRKKLFSSGSVNGEIVELHCKIEDFESSSAEFTNLKKEVLSLLRCEENFEQTLRDLSFFLMKYYKQFDDPLMSFELETRAILIHALFNYRACFVYGDGAGMKPMAFVDKSYEEKEIHLKVRMLADKLIGHFDKNSMVRTDEVIWNFSLNQNGITPTKPWLKFSKILNLHRDELLEWQVHISDLLKLVKERLNTLKESINSSIEIKD